MQDDGDVYIPTINSDNESGTFVDNSSYQNKDDDSDNETLHEEPKGKSDDEEEEEQFEFDEWFVEEMDYENEMTKTQHLPPIPLEMQDASQLLSLSITSKASFHCMRK